MLTLLLLILGSLYFCLFLRAFQITHNSKDRFGFIYRLAGFIGAFVWEDLLVISFASFLGCIIVLVTHDIRVGLLLVAIFWIVRSAGEVLYFFLQQFHVPGHSPHNIDQHFLYLRSLLGDVCIQKCYIVMQLMWQMVLVGAGAFLAIILLHWNTIPTWF